MVVAVEFLPMVEVVAVDGHRVVVAVAEGMYPPQVEAEATAVEVVAVDMREAITNTCY